jgi:hypothetical protein
MIITMKSIDPKHLLIVLMFLASQVGCNHSFYPTTIPQSPSSTSISVPFSTTVVKSSTPTVHKATPTLSATASSVPTIKFTLTPTLESTLEIIHSKLDCTPGKLYTKCTDERLQIEYEYPNQWGEINTLFHRGGISGYAYEYQFGTSQSTLYSIIHAGGRSFDFSDGREGYITDFSGFDAHIPGQGCNDTLAAHCKEIKPGVILEVYTFRAEEFCHPVPGVYGYPILEVRIDLPNHPTINGFVFVSRLWTEKTMDEIDRLLGYDPPSGYYTKCSDQEIIKQVNAKIDAVIRALKTNSLDAETRVNYTQMLHLAQSIKFIR